MPCIYAHGYMYNNEVDICKSLNIEDIFSVLLTATVTADNTHTHTHTHMRVGAIAITTSHILLTA